MAVKITFKDDKKYGIPEQKKFPMPDKQHVISAIKFFNYVTPKYEKQLAKAILARMREYGMSFEDVGVGDDNRFSKYIPKKDQELAHHGILGMKWGVRRFQNKDGSLTEAGQKRYLSPNSSYSDTKANRAVIKNYNRYLVEESRKEFDNIVSMPNSTKSEREKKIVAEKEFIDSAMNDHALDKKTSAEEIMQDFKDLSRSQVLMDVYNEKSGNWYESTSVSKAHADAMRESKRLREQYKKTFDEYWKGGKKNKKLYAKYTKEWKEYCDYKDHITAVVLKDIGFEDAPVNYDNGRYIWEWD